MQRLGQLASSGSAIWQPAALPVSWVAVDRVPLSAMERIRSGQYATTTQNSQPESRAIGRGYGFRTRFKNMSRQELQALLRQKKASGDFSLKEKVVKVQAPTPAHRKGAFEHAWTSIGRLTRPYTSSEINKQDMFAIIEAGHGQFKVVPDDRIFVHRLNGAYRELADDGSPASARDAARRVDVNDVIQFNRVLLCGTPSDTLVGRPYLPGVAVTAAVEEHIRDAPVYIYKRRRAKGYRKFRGFRAELTALRILGIHGTDSLGVPVPQWDAEKSTPLQKPLPLGQRVRNQRKRRNRVQRRLDNAVLQEWLKSRTHSREALYTDYGVADMPAAKYGPVHRKGQLGQSALQSGAGDESVEAIEYDGELQDGVDEQVSDSADQPRTPLK